jgi:hypothetical protein
MHTLTAMMMVAPLMTVGRGHHHPPALRAVATAGDSTVVFPLDGPRGLRLIETAARAVSYKGRSAVQIVEAPGVGARDALAMIDGTDFANGTIEVMVAGTLGPHADTSDRGFVGIAFRSAADGSRFENLYLRPTNGRAENQLRRNHSVQYESVPEYPWFRLRKENPGQYESYVDLEAGAWTKLRIVVEGTRAALFVNDAPNPCLIVTDLKLGPTHGQIGLWIGSGTEAYFSRLTVYPRP